MNPSSTNSTPPKKKRRWLKRSLFTLLAFSALLCGSCALITQPTMKKNAPSTQRNSEQNLQAHVRFLAEEVHPRNYQNLDNLNAAADYIAAEFAKAGAQVERQSFQAAGSEYQNVIARFGDHSSGKPLLIIGAHYDSYNNTPGADDNASGVAGLLELAQLISRTELKNQRLELVAYTLEEPPFFRTEQMGSFVHAKSHHEAGTPITAMINLEMIGYFSDEKGSQDYPIGLLHLLYPSKGNYIAVVGNMGNMGLTKEMKIGMRGTTDLGVRSLNAPSVLPGIDFSDHGNYWKFDIPAVMITDTAFYRNPNYHETTDTWDTLNYPKMGQTVVAVYEAIKQLAEKDN